MRKEYMTVRITDLKPYENNPRFNDDAVEDVGESITQVGYINPIIVDESMEILAGHTRLKALSQTDIKEIDVLVVSGLTDEQKRKYRILDNKVQERSGWDFEKLEKELELIDFEGYDFGFSFDDMTLDFGEDAEKPVKEKEDEEIVCPHCGMKFFIQ